MLISDKASIQRVPILPELSIWTEYVTGTCLRQETNLTQTASQVLSPGGFAAGEMDHRLPAFVKALTLIIICGLLGGR
jgi:hypothetical protein